MKLHMQPQTVKNAKIIQISGRSSSVERSVWDREVVGSIPSAPTKHTSILIQT